VYYELGCIIIIVFIVSRNIILFTTGIIKYQHLQIINDFWEKD